MSLVDRIRTLLRKRRNRQAHLGHTGEATKAKHALHDLKGPKPAPAPPAAHGFMPGANDENITPGANDPAITPVGVILHVAVSESDDLHDLFENDGGIESHFYVTNDGTVRQYRSIYFEADAQFAGNSFGSPREGFISVETEGMGTGTWNAAQLASIKAIIQWVHSQEAFPLRVCPAWDQGGVGYHRQFIQWNTDNHSCPGDQRVVQFRRVIAPWVEAGAK